MRPLILFASAVALFALCSAPARANDSEAEIAIGGLTLKRSDAISMESEDLYISRDRIRVTYRFLNTSDAPVETLVAFPLPEIPPAQEDVSGYWGDVAELSFRTLVDGQPIALENVEQAIFKDQDVSARLKALGVPLNRFSKNFDSAINALAKADRDKLVADGLLRDDGFGDQHYWAALWALRTSITRRQTFPPKAAATVEHEYVPRAGGSVGGGLDPSQRKSDYFAQVRRKYCIDDEFLASFDRKLKTSKKGDGLAYSEVWLGYVLKTGANWKGPIRDFRLVVDKGKKDSLVSFCAEGVKKISPTQFESRRRDFTPTQDLNVLIADFTR